MADQAHSTQPANAGYETTDADVLPLFKFLAFLAVFIGFSVFAVVILFKFLNYYQPLFDDPVSPLAATRNIDPDVPRLQVDPPQQKVNLRAYETQLLKTYGWINKEAGVARIPVERAMALMVAGHFKVDLIAPPEETSTRRKKWGAK